jgi:hypothetical protein
MFQRIDTKSKNPIQSYNNCTYCNEKTNIKYLNKLKNRLIIDNDECYAYMAGMYAFYVITQNHETKQSHKFINELLNICKYLSEKFDVTQTRILINDTSSINSYTNMNEKKHTHGWIILTGKLSQKWYDTYFNCYNGMTNKLSVTKKNHKKKMNIDDMPYDGDPYFKFTDDLITNFLSLSNIDEFLKLINSTFTSSNSFSIFINGITIIKETNYRVDIDNIIISIQSTTTESLHKPKIRDFVRKNSFGSDRKNSFDSNRKNSFGSDRKNSFDSNRKNSFDSNRKNSFGSDRKNSFD